MNQELSVSLNPSDLPRPSPRLSRFRAVVSESGGLPGRWHTWLESEKKHCRPLRLGADVRKALQMIVQNMGEVEVSEHHALAMHATAGAAKVDVVRKQKSQSTP